MRRANFLLFQLMLILPAIANFMKHHLLTCLICLFYFGTIQAQEASRIIRTKEGQSLGPKRAFVALCKKAYGAPADNPLITKICECQADLLDERYSRKQIKNYQKTYGGRAINMLMEDDTLLQKQMKECGSGMENQLLLDIPEYRKSFVSKCIDNLKLKSIQPVNDTLAAIFCNCAANVMEKRKITLEQFDDLANPSSFLYNEIAYKCGSPYLKSSDFAPGWSTASSADILGSVPIDSIQVISLMGMHKVKITIGSTTKIWMLDSGASDLFISEEYARELKAKGLLSEMNYIGEGLYSLANNSVVSCKRYKINGVKIGKFELNNIIIATSKEAKEFLLGKALLNKFSQWTLDNKNDVLILKK